MKRLSIFLIALVAILGCANQGSGPDGGPYDENPPRIVGMTPPEKVADGKRTKFSLVFDELIKVENPNEKITVSPPQIETPEIKVSGRRITVQLLDSLIPNTTYTVDFSDAITDNNEGNPLGQYTYIFSTGMVTDTMQMAGRVLNAEDLEPLKGVLVGLYESDADSAAFSTIPFQRVARTDATGRFSIKGVSPSKRYRIHALQDSDNDFKFSTPSELLAFYADTLTPSSYPDVRYDTLWIDTVRYDSIRVIPFTHFTPDDVVLLAFKEARQPRHFLKSVRNTPEFFTTFFTGRSDHRPTIKGLNFNEKGAFIEQASPANDTITYWLADTTLLRQESLNFAYSYEAWDDSLQKTYLTTDTLELAPRTTFAKREAERIKELEKWEKERERRHKRGDFSNEQPPINYHRIKSSVSSTLVPDKNILFTFEEPIAHLDLKGFHLMLRVDSLLHEAPFELDSVPGNILARQLRAEWRPGQRYELHIDSAAVRTIYDRVNNTTKSSFSISKLEDFGTIFLQISDATPSLQVQLLDANGKVLRQVPTLNGRAEIYYIAPGTYYLRAFNDRNGDGVWTTGEWESRTQPEEVYYYPEEVSIRANWDNNLNWTTKAKPIDQQKPSKITKQKEQERRSTTRQRNIERLRQRGQQ